MAKRGRPPKNDADLRTKEITIRVSEREFDKITQSAADAKHSVHEFTRLALTEASLSPIRAKALMRYDEHLTTSEILREFVVNTRIAPPPDADLVSLMIEIADSLNDISEHIRDMENTEICDTFNELSTALSKILPYL